MDLPKGAPGMREVTSVKTLEELAVLWGVRDDYEAQVARRKERSRQIGQGQDAAGSNARDCIHK